MKALLRFCAALALCAIVASPIFAQTTPPTTPTTAAQTVTVPASPAPTTVVVPAAPTAPETPAWLNTLAVIGIAITMGLVGLGIGIFNKKTGLENNATALEIEAHARDALHTALESLAGRAIVELGPKINGAILNIQNPTIRAIAQAAPGLAGDAIKFFGLSPDTVAQKIIDKIGVLTAANPAATPSATGALPTPAA